MAAERDVRTEALVQAGLALASELSLPAVLQKIVNLACEVADARYGALGVLGPDGLIEEFVTYGVTEEERRAIGALPVGKGILGVLITDARPLRLRRIADDPRSVGFPANHPPMETFLGVPVSVHGTVYGNLYLTEKRGGEGFTEEDENALVTLAVQAGVAVENARLYHEAGVRERRLEAIGEVNRAILDGDDIDRILGRIVGSARALADADMASIAVPERAGADLVLRAVDGLHAEDLLGVPFPSQGTVSGEGMHTREPVVLEDASMDAHAIQRVLQVGDLGPAMFLPLAAGDRVFGTLVVANVRGGRRLGERDLAVVRPFAEQAAVALDHARLREDQRRLDVLVDRERIAKDLHDGVVQSLFAVGMSLQAGGSLIHDPEALRRRLEDAVEDIDRVIRDLRNYIFGLGPGQVADRQLDQAIRDLAEEFRRGSDLVIRAEVEPEVGSLLAPHAGEIVQAVREAVSNAARHAGAETLAVVVRRDDAEALIEVEDDGKGFDVEGAAGKGHGLSNLRARAENLGGRLEIESVRKVGTAVRIHLPLEPRW